MAHFTVIGLGTFGITTSAELIHMGHTVTGVDSSEKLCSKYSDKFTQTVICDATDERALKELNLLASDTVLVAIGDDMQASLLCTLHLKNLGVEELWVKATSGAHHTILSKLGVSRIVHPEEEMGVRVANALNYPMVNDYINLGDHLHVIEVHIVDNISGTPLSDLLGKESELIAVLLIKRGEELICKPELEFELQGDDVVLFLGPKESLEYLAPRLV